MSSSAGLGILEYKKCLAPLGARTSDRLDCSLVAIPNTLPRSLSKLEYLKGHAMAQLVVAVCYKQEGRGFDSRWCYWNFSLT